MELQPKRVKDSYTEQVQILYLSTLNGYNRLFGGRLMQWIDVVAAVVARRHSGCNVTTATVDSLEFLGPAYANDTLVLKGKITYVGTTSMEIRVDSFVEELSGKRRLVNTAYVVMVAIDENERPCRVPALIVETKEELCEYQMAEQRYLARKQRQKK